MILNVGAGSGQRWAPAGQLAKRLCRHGLQTLPESRMAFPDTDHRPSRSHTRADPFFPGALHSATIAVVSTHPSTSCDHGATRWLRARLPSSQSHCPLGNFGFPIIKMEPPAELTPCSSYEGERSEVLSGVPGTELVFRKC